jgi:RNA 2',3'-cyclic 3'-phosphodiesterase
MAAKKNGQAIRAFVALDLDTVSVRRVARVADRLRMGSGAPSAAWTPSAKLHVTMKFMGELSLDAVLPFGNALGVLASGKRAPRPGSFRLDAFPSVEEAEIVVAELEDPFGDLGKLAVAVDKLAKKHGCPTETRPFRPHVTLARLKRPYDTRRWLRPELAGGADECAAIAVTLYRSDRGAEGSTYVKLATFAYAS